MNNVKLPTVYFYVRNDPGNLQEDCITLAEGFQQLGVPYYANCDYWLQTTAKNDFLFRANPDVHHSDCDIVVVSYTWPYWIRMGSFDLVERPLPQGLFSGSKRPTTVYMDSHDGHRTVSWQPEFRKFDLILRSKLNKRSWHPGNMKPWVLGFTSRILDATHGSLPFSERNRSILINFGASHPYPHGTRDLAATKFEPEVAKYLKIDRTKDNLQIEPDEDWDRMHWVQTGGRFSRSYYERLKRSMAVSCFCGELIPPAPYHDPECYLVGGNRAKMRRIYYEFLAMLDPRPRRSVQWDSFRFWEALCAGCAVFNLDLDYYGVDIPVMPVNWKHYIGIRLHSKCCLQRLRDEPNCMEDIARQGREWALEHYSPKAMAKRFLSLLGYQFNNEAPNS